MAEEMDPNNADGNTDDQIPGGSDTGMKDDTNEEDMNDKNTESGA